MVSIIEKVESFLVKHNLTDEKNIIVAFSGGWDSMCLLDVVSKLGKKHNFATVAIHLNHNWRGEESKKEAVNCLAFCNSNNIEFYCETLKDSTPKTETAARDARYCFFEKCAKKYSSNCVLTAHNFDDNAETVLYRIAKGTGSSGLEGIKEKRGIYYRPLLGVPREEIEVYCNENNFAPNNDSSNQNTKYKRNLIRKEIMPLLKTINNEVSSAINSLSELSIEDNEIINEYIEKIKESVIEDDVIKTEAFDKLSKPVQKRILHQLFMTNNLDYDREKINNAFDFICENKNSKAGKIHSLSSNLWLFVSSSQIEVIKKQEPKEINISVDKIGEYECEDFIFKIEPYETKIYEFPNDNMMMAYVDLSNFKEFDFTLRTRLDGDIIVPLGLKGTQKLKKYLNAKKIPNHKKDSLILLCQNKEVFWAGSLGVSEKIKVVNTPTHVLRLLYK